MRNLLLLLALFVPTSSAQELLRPAPASAEPVRPEPAPAPEGFTSVIVLFGQKAYDLGGYREAIMARRPAGDVDAIVAGLERAAVESRREFVTALERIGGRVSSHWWIIDGACVLVPTDRKSLVAELPGVTGVHDDVMHHALIVTATNSAHHNSDGANTRNAPSGGKVTGLGLGVAILDTGADGSMGGTGRPHAMYYQNGQVSGTNLLRVATGTSGYGSEDQHGHGTMVASCAAGGGWPYGGSDRGIAPDAGKISVKMSNDQGSAASNWIIGAWQYVASVKATHKIVAANNSFSGSPSLNDPIQQALDSLAYNADVVAVVAGGNTGSSGTGSSQRAYNGIAAGSINKNSLAVSSFSSRGPIGAATYPDIAAVGASVVMALRDQEASAASASGTSFSAPFVAGGAVLVRQAGGLDAQGNPVLTALETKAILLNYTQDISAQNGNAGPNYYGMGMMRCDLAVDAAIGGMVVRDTVSTAAPTKSFQLTMNANERRSVTISWMRSNVSSSATDNLDLRVFNPGNGLVASSLSTANAYEKVTFTAATAGVYRVDVTATSLTAGSREFALAGAVPKTPPQPPVLTALSPGQVKAFSPPEVTLTGTNLGSVSKVTVGGVDVTNPTVVSDTTVRFTPPTPTTLGNVNVTVTNPAATSNALPLAYVGTHPAALVGPAILASTQTYTFGVWSDASWISVVFVSPDKVPSVVPNVVDFAIGNNFQRLILLLAVGNGPNGFGSFQLAMPPNAGGMVFHLQSLQLDLTNPVPPFETSNALSCSIFI